MLPLPWPFDREFMQLALFAGLVVGVCAPLVGSFLVQKRLSLMGDGIGHLAFAGVALGLFVGVWPFWSALLIAIAGAIGMELLRSRRRIPSDLVLALFFYTGIAAGVVLTSASGSLDASVLSYLFGSILTVEPSEVWVIGGVGMATVIVMTILFRGLFAVVLDEQSALVAGLPVTGLNLALMILTSVTIVSAMRVVGLLLVAALMVLPVAAAQLIAQSFRTTVLISIGIACIAVVLGLTAARAFALAPGGTIVIVVAVIYGLTSLVARRLRRLGTMSMWRDNVAA